MKVLGDQSYNNPPVVRRRYPSQGSQSNRYSSRPKSAFEILAYQNQYLQNRRKSVESLINSRNAGGPKTVPPANNTNERQGQVSEVKGRGRIKSQGDSLEQDETANIKIKAAMRHQKRREFFDGKANHTSANKPTYATIGTATASSGKDSDVSH
jgi:hypothetical protein